MAAEDLKVKDGKVVSYCGKEVIEVLQFLPAVCPCPV